MIFLLRKRAIPMTRFLFSAAVAALALAAGHARAADHLDAPSLSGAGQVDINDLYAFQSPSNPDNSVLIMTVNPLAGVLSPTTFDPSTSYAFSIDNNGDAVADLTYTAEFAAPSGGSQAYTITRDAGGSSTAYPGATGTTSASGGVMSTAGVFDDPFFFDLAGFTATLGGTGTFTGDDFFAGADVSAIVLEVPSSDLVGMDANIAVWASTLDASGSQIDRIGRPAINTVLIAGDANKEAFNTGQPADDPANFGAGVQAQIEALNGGDTATAATLTGILLPDVLTFDTSSPAGFLNGRGLADDVIDAELGLLTNNAITTDLVDANDAAFLGVFPYLAPANVPEPGAALLLLTASAALVRRRR